LTVLAQISDPISVVVVGLAALITLVGGIFGMAVAIRTLFVKPIEPGKEFVTRGELMKIVGDIENKIDAMKCDIGERLEKQSEYARATAHEHANAVNSIGLKVERLLVMRELEPGRRPSRADDGERAGGS